MTGQSEQLAGIILAAGKGTRINSKLINKVVYTINGKPMVLYGVELLEKLTDQLVLVVGAFAESVTQVLKAKKNITFVEQKHRLGTGHAVKVALKALEKNPPKLVLVGMGDHMMFYKPETIQKLIDVHRKNEAAVSVITTVYHDPSSLAWGRVERDKSGKVLDIVEQKDANEKQKKIKELNAGFYCFDYKFLRSSINLISKSKVTGEYYLTDLFKVARLLGLPVVAIKAHFREVGIGVNRHEELIESQKLFKRFPHS